MSEEYVGFVRKPLRVRDRSSRTLEQRLRIRFPKLPRITYRLASRLPPTSRLRQAVVWRAWRLAIEAFNRRDLEAVLINLHPEFEFRPFRQMADSGIAEPSYRGHAGYLRYMSSWFGTWGVFRFEPQELIDLGDRLVALGKLAGRGGASGGVVDQGFAAVVHLKDGLLIREQDYFDPAEALEAVGLRA
jgi:ketosteroid isomerase-like protein